MADKYILKVTAGPNYHEQSQIPINTSDRTTISSDHLTASLQVRIQSYRGLPADSPTTSPYFSHPSHRHDRYSLEFTFTLKDEDINGHDLVFGNDFDHPIRDKLPPGFNQAFSAVKWFVDPGLYGDVYAEEPYLYGPLLSSMNVLRVGPKDDREQEKAEEVRANRQEEDCLEEGGDGDGLDNRRENGVPDDAAARKKHFLTEQHLKDFTFEKGREYGNDFFNAYLDFNGAAYTIPFTFIDGEHLLTSKAIDFSLKLPGWGMIPGITLPIISYWDGQPLRYVMKKRNDNEPLLVVIFELLPKEQVGAGNEAGEKKEDDGDDDELD